MKTRPLSLYLLTSFILFLAVGALYGGYSLLIDVDGGAMQFSATWLEGTPFDSYLIPGLLLFNLFGVGSLVVTFVLWTRPRIPLLDALLGWTHAYWGWTAAFLLGVGLIVWIAVQMVMLREVGTQSLQILMGATGIAIALLTLMPDMRRYYAQ